MDIPYTSCTPHPCSRLTIDDTIHDVTKMTSQFFNIKKDQKISIYKDDCTTWRITANVDFIMAYFENRVWYHADHTKEEIAHDKIVDENLEHIKNQKKLETIKREKG